MKSQRLDANRSSEFNIQQDRENVIRHSGKRPGRYWNAIVAHIYVNGAAEAIEFYKKAFGAEELFRVAGKNGKIVHAEIAICSSVIMIGDPGEDSVYGGPRELGGCTAGLHIMVDDNAALLRRAMTAGTEQIQPITDMFYGASSCSVRDPFGHVWVMLSWKKDFDTAEIERRGNIALSERPTGNNQ
ncbi:VOC family protein [Mucilaginibacter pocheonensis]|uniref:PhnB protein n=1 Tax=Mucilaginibacter pocheonensis TaxID=398050 RepID=A0ABU1TCG6_9SPHI|nr:VOC family protein [Mucilaginibacter pocheonensis]MDR6943004.1 PhnB protein [Mucilaginibacter pocheonensis]